MSQFWKEFQRGFKDFSSHINFFANTVFLLIVYVVGVGLAAFWAKLLRKRFLDVELERTATTYWLDSDLGSAEKEDYYRQF